MFVQLNGSEYAVLGIGKLVDQRGSLCFVEYFDSPTAQPIVHQIESELIEQVTLAGQTRIYHFDEAAGSWEIGRLLDDHGDSQLVQFPNSKTKHLKVAAVFVRWARPIEDPTLFLANRINESPRFSDGRSAFVRSQTSQRAASMGMSALLASAIEIEAHQVEVVRRILQDPVQRYLLADEVGLGKTIEAGVLIRQCVLDTENRCSVLLIVPPALVKQWRWELANKFFLGPCLDHSIDVVSIDDEDRIRALLPNVTMLVIDEAHHLTKQKTGAGDGLYHVIAAASPSIERVLLLSATPALHNEGGFLRMLHLLDSLTYPLDGEAAFRQKIESRQTLAEIVAGLTPENALYLDYTIEQLVVLFPNDDLLQELAEGLRGVIDTMPDPDDPALIEAIGLLHAHLSEVYRLHRRILRNRRRSIGGLTPERSGAEIIGYRSSDRASLTAALEDWRFNEALKLDVAGSDKDWSDRVRAFWELLEGVSQYPAPEAAILGSLADQPAEIADCAHLASVNRCLGREGLFEDRAQALLKALATVVGSRTQCVVFCSDPKTADALTKRIRDGLRITVDRHDPDDDAWTAFTAAVDHPVLVCDRRAEEGLNLQGGKKVVIHYDLPLNPNRIEQRLGRVDRYGSGDAVRSFVLACEDDPMELAWIDFLNIALRVFDRSVASLQYLIDQTVGEIARTLFTDGSEAIVDLTARATGDQGFIEREIKSIDQQDALDALGAPSTAMVDELSDVDEDWQTLASDTAAWLDQTLQFGRTDIGPPLTAANGAAPFRYVYSTGNPHTLVSLPAFLVRCANALDLEFAPRYGRAIKTIPYTFRRRTALGNAARAEGVGLLRYGDPLINGLTALTDADDRGRSFAMWRFAPDHIGDQPAEFYFRFDFLLEADSAAAMRVLATHGRDTSAARAAVRRRGDMALVPFYRSIWLDRELNPVHDVALLARLSRPYSVKPDRNGALDVNLNSRRWPRLFKLQLPELAHWRELCEKARMAAEDLLRSDPELITSLRQAEQRAASIDHGRLGQLKVRVRENTGTREREEFGFEEQLANELRAGINGPRVRLDTIGAVFISSNRSTTDQIAGGV
ncbi:SNF2 family protein [Neorhizobium galegae bv. officinalis]|nr:SNF2 family protein [Neorhizobium galegae bv. officinalis]